MRVAEIVEMEGRGHALTIDSGWREVADTALAFVDEAGLSRGQSQPSVVAACSRVAATTGSPSTEWGTESGSRRLPSR